MNQIQLFERLAVALAAALDEPTHALGRVGACRLRRVLRHRILVPAGYAPNPTRASRRNRRTYVTWRRAIV
jgi:hypothetical protein